MPQTKVVQQSESPVTTTDSRPVPDPTVLTTQQLTVAIANVTQLFETRLEAMDKAVSILQSTANQRPTPGEIALKADEKFASSETRLLDFKELLISKIAEGIGIHASKIESMEKRLDHKYVETATDLRHLHDLMAERISGLKDQVAAQFNDRDKRAEQLALASTTAISAALQAQKEAAGETQKSSYLAITKSETATADSIKQLQTLFQTAIAGLSAQLADVKSRLDKGEGQGAGRGSARDDYRYERSASHDQSVDNRGMVAIAISAVAVIVTIVISFMSKG